jgi:PAS domain S-box-containing protein
VPSGADETRGDRDRDLPEPPRVGRGAALRAVAIYGALALAWILFSDLVLEVLVSDPVARGEAQSLKGALFVVASGAVLYVLLRRQHAGIAFRDRRLRATLDSMVDAVLVADAHARFVDANARAAELLAHRPTPESPLALVDHLRAADLRHADGRPQQLHDLAAFRALHGETVAALEARLRDAGGHERFVSISAAPLWDGGPAPSGAVVVVRDIGEVKRFEEMREEFLATAAHELKTPLAVVKAHAQLMQRRGQGDAAALQAITRQADRLARIVQQLLEVSRFRVGGGDLRPERFDLADVAAEVVADLPQPDAARVRVARDGAAPVQADRQRIAQVVRNLVENALRFSPGGSEVLTTVGAAAAEAVLSVRDRGVGIPADRQARVFERYYRAHAGTPQDYGGLGLGLDVSREIVARHGGRIWFESTPGEGSTFTFSLPLAEGG